jgi:heterodisulfide reductase subunit A-like polyferredoxin
MKGVYPGVEFLREVNLGNRVPLGERVAVVGGGNVAMDSVRTALRTGSSKAFVIYRRSYDEMPANKEEIEECAEEGIEIMTLTNPTRIIGENGKVKAVECIKMELGEPDKSGRRRPVPIAGSEFVIEVDAVIPAIGQESDWACLTDECTCTLNDWGTMNVDPVTLQSNDPDIFAGGDAVSGPATVVEAVAAGKEAAISIDRFVRGADLREGRQKKWDPVPYADVLKGEAVSEADRMKMPHLTPQDRMTNFNEVQLGFDEDRAKKEAERCLSCGICSECYQCVKACLAGAVDHSQSANEREIPVGAMILCPGSTVFDPSVLDEFLRYKSSPNVMTSLEFERILSASGPTMGHLTRPSDEKAPKKIAWLQCVGSRDTNTCGNAYCSSVCCMYAIKEAVIAKEHSGGDLDCAIFFMDMRTYGKDFERYYEAAKRQGVRFIRSRVHTVDPAGDTDDLEIRFATEDGTIETETFDLIVLSVGFQTDPKVAAMAKSLGIELTDGNFCKTSTAMPVETSKEGIYVCGAFQGPKDIPQSVVDASAAAAAAGEILSTARNTLTKFAEPVPETNVINERPRVGVFVCKCGINIAGVVDVPDVRDYSATLPYVEYVTDNMYTCSQDTQDSMSQIIRENNLNRIIVAACTPKTHEPLFQETLINAGLNKYLFEMVNIRNQDSWVHRNNPDIATQKAKDLVRMAVEKVVRKEPLKETELNVHQTALVIGGGIAGMTAALSLARQGFETHLVERDGVAGGQARHLHKTWKGEDIQEMLAGIIADVEKEENLRVHLNTTVKSVEGFVGNFKTTLLSGDIPHSVEHGIAVIATGASEYKPTEYCYGDDPRIVTSLELDRLFIADDPALKDVETAVFIQCVGSREPERPYCSRTCCTHSVESALEFKRRNPDTNVYILYRDIRTYGEREAIYKEARELGVIFIRYSFDNKPQVKVAGGKVLVTAKDHVLGRPVQIEADMLTLATAIVPYKDEQLAQYFKVPLNEDGFFVERHAKLGPSEFATDGVFLCGLAHYPKSIDESVVQGKAAASRAITLLSQKKIFTSGEIASVNPMFCSSCGVCVSVCPYSAPSFIPADARFFAGKAQINPALCKGCGLCVASCRSGAIGLKGFDNDQIFAMIEAV